MLDSSIDVIDEVEQNFINSSYDVNTNRAFPSVYDGLKPGARAILWTMYKNKFTSDKPHVKSAKVDGSVAANFWPHGTTAIYETFVHMSQDFNMNNPEVDFHGNNGNVIVGDVPASDRYTETRLSKLAERYVLDGIDKDSVDMVPNYLEDDVMPTVMPSVFPSLLVNGSQGIGVSLSQTFLPHNLTETCNLITGYLSTGVLDDDTYYPDFPTGGTIINESELSEINKTGKGRCVLRGKYEVNGNVIKFTELPYQVYIEDVISEIKDCIDKDKLHGISDVYNSSDKHGISITVECANSHNVNSVLDELFQYTHLSNDYHANQNAIISKTPTLLNLRQIVDYYVSFNLECIKRVCKFDAKNLADRIEVIKGLIVAIENIDDCVSIIKDSNEPKDKLAKKYGLTDRQVSAILSMRLSSLSKLESKKLRNELDDKTASYEKCIAIIGNDDMQKEVLISKLKSMSDEFGRKRKTVVKNIATQKVARSRKAAEPEELMISLSSTGYLNKSHVSDFKMEHGLQVVRIMSDNLVIVFTDKGRFFRISPKDIKPISATKGQPFGNIVKLEDDERPILMIQNNGGTDKRPYIVFVSKRGRIKKSDKSMFFGNTRNLRGSKSADGFEFAFESNGDVLSMTSRDGYRLDVKCNDINPTKSGRGRIGMKLHDGDELVDAHILEDAITSKYIGRPGNVGKKAR